ncbi:carbohydrate ABC transporter permease [Cellulomonas cellasea]|uniref:ABC transmembrane type-1 domain-containing protein n=2 Tax=Cellulomonas cellasea TaxID=43670 RepID=A0A0A0B4J4_9CELL|nr:carbohydrate ABC transporter permease [Cellulomonas cellasea]KGM01067.1 hypothetical protein Q760_04170 [Cellulomonas cellasea DSM 20118]GEA87535.1 sugar ABC transporter permease [Cellulomonas cellasea]
MLIALAFLVPLLLVVHGSLRGRGLAPATGPELVPAGATLAAYADLFRVLPLDTFLRNSLLVAAVAVPLTVVVASLAGWGIRLLGRRARVAAVAGVVLVMLVPASSVWATRFEVLRALRLDGTVLTLALPALMGTSAFFVLVYVWAYHQVDDDTLAAAALDGAGHLTAWARIAMPQGRSATFAVAALAFAWHWGNFLDPLLYVRSPGSYTAPLGVRTLQQLAPTDWPLLMAAVAVLALPPVVVFLVAQRRFLSDDTLSAEAR